MFGRRGRARVSRELLLIMAWNAFLAYSNVNRKPPVTIGLIAANTLIYLRPSFLRKIIPVIDEVGFNPYMIIKYKDFKRFLLSPFYHVDDTHLVFNMVSLLWKGIQLENSMETSEFVSMVIALIGMSQGFTMLIAISLLLFNYDAPYYHQNGIGFSGLLFAMKVVLDSRSEYANLHGYTVPARYAAWLELVFIQLLAPHVSFIGHLGGILAGLLYVELKSSRFSPGSLTTAVRGVITLLEWPFRSLRSYFGRGRIFGRGRVGGTRYTRSAVSGSWSCRSCTFENSGVLSVCEMCDTDRDDGSLPVGSNISMEELRRRRVQRFAR